MRNLIRNSLFLFALVIGGTIFAQNANVISLTQVEGDFKKQKDLKLKAGEAYIFEVTNENVGHEVGFVVVPKGKSDQEHHIKNAYVQEMVATGKSSQSKVVVLEKGEYEYFCPMNPTPHYNIIVD